MVDVSEILRAMPMLRGVPQAELALLPARRVERQAGERFFSQGDPSDFSYGILTGRVRIAKQSLGGREISLEVLGPGDLVAAVAVLRGIPMPASAIALEPTAMLEVPAPAFKKLLELHPGLAARMLDLISQRLVEAGQSRLSLATEPVEVRLAQALLRLAEKFGSMRGEEVVFSQSFTRQNLADLAGTTVESTIRTMGRWTRAGWIRSNAARISILQPEELKRIARADA